MRTAVVPNPCNFLLSLTRRCRDESGEPRILSLCMQSFLLVSRKPKSLPSPSQADLTHEREYENRVGQTEAAEQYPGHAVTPGKIRRRIVGDSPSSDQADGQWQS
jgi:hypothetical protein